MSPEMAERLLERTAIWLSRTVRTPGWLPFILDVIPEREEVRLRAWWPEPLDQNLRRASDTEAAEISRLLLAERQVMQIADHGARSLLIGHGRLETAWLARRRPHFSPPVIALPPDDRLALALWIAQADLDTTPLLLQGGSAHDRIERARRLPELPPDLETRLRTCFPRLAAVRGDRVKALLHLPEHSPPQLLSIA